LILIGAGWQSIFDQVFNKLGNYSPQSQHELLQFAPEIKTAVEMLDTEI
jgi:hypothetical protein